MTRLHVHGRGEQGRLTGSRKREAVVRILRGESLEAVFRDLSAFLAFLLDTRARYPEIAAEARLERVYSLD